MASLFNFLLLFFVANRASGLNDFIYGDNEDDSFNCTEVLIRKFGSKANYHIEYIHTVARCPSDYDSNSTIKQKCETEPASKAIIEDIFLFTLGLDLATKTVIYFNVYCAICNGLKEFYQYLPHFYYQLDEAQPNEYVLEGDGGKNYPIFEHSPLLSRLKWNESSGQLVSYNQLGIRFRFKPYRVLIVPKRSKKIFSDPMQPFRPPHLPFCENTPHRDFQCDGNSSKIDNCFHYDDKYGNIFDSKEILKSLRANCHRSPDATYCPQKRIHLGEESSDCQYEDDHGYVCKWNRFLMKGVDYVEADEGEIFFVDDYLMLNMTRDEYSTQTGIKNVIYLCGVDQKGENEDQYCIDIMNSIQALLRRVSLFCVVVYLLIHSRCKILANLIEKITYSYYATLLMMYIREELSEGLKKKNCFLEYLAYRYLLQSYTFWILISSWYIWKVTRSPDAEQGVATRTNKTYLVMCLICWLLPAVICSLFHIMEAKVSCPAIPGYDNLASCDSPDEIDPYFVFIFFTIFIICIVVLAQFLTSCYRYQFGKKKRVEGEGHNDWRNRMLFFFKIVYSIVLYAMLLIASIVDRDGAAYGILLHLWSFHGTLIFFLYSFKTSVVKNMFSKRGAPEGAERGE